MTTTSANVAMAGQVKIAFTQPGVQPPVYVVTSLSDPPWETLELEVTNEQTDSGNLIFARQFDNVKEGSYQYKIRIGDGYWVVDESKDSATDGSGNRNNVIYVKAEVQSPSLHSSTNDYTVDRTDFAQHHNADPSPGPSRDTDTPKASTSPTPFVVVDRVADKEPPEYGDVEYEPLREDAAKRTADAEPDVENVQPETPLEKQNEPASLPVPIVVLEKTDDTPSHGDDFGKDATSAQKVAHELRAADATPDKVIVSPDPELKSPELPVGASDTEAGAENDERAVPLFPHETSESKSEPVYEKDAPLFHHESSEPDVPGEGSGTESISTDDIAEKEPAVLTAEHQGAPLFPHETIESEAAEDDADADPASNIGIIEEESERSSTDRETSHASHEPQFDVSERRAEDDEVENESLGELDDGPLLSHEPGFSEENKYEDTVEDELGNGPLLPHETGFSGTEVVDADKIIDEEYDEDFEEDPASPDHDSSEAPLLPHERDSRDTSRNNSVALGGDQTFPYETAIESPMFGNSQYFLHRTSTNGSLPHRLPRSDEEDEDLKDPLLEQFPTNREQILERVATITSYLPVDETRDQPHSPQLSVKSQACSSVDLRPTTSHTSLRPVDEEEDSDEEEFDEKDLDESDSGKDDHLAMGDQSRNVVETKETNGIALPKPSEYTEPSSRSLSSSDAESVQKNDGAHESSRYLDTVYGAIATPAKTLNPLTPPLTPERNAPKSDSADGSEDVALKGLQETEETHSKPRSDTSQTPSDAQDPTSHSGGHRQASGAALVLGVAVAAYYYLNRVKG